MSPVGVELPSPLSPGRLPQIQDGGPPGRRQSDEESVVGGAEPYASSGDEYVPGQEGSEWEPAPKRKKRRVAGRLFSPVASEPKPRDNPVPSQPVPGTSRNSGRGNPLPGTSRSAGRRSHNNESYRKELIDYYEQDSLSGDESNAAGRGKNTGPARRRPRSPPDEYVQLAVTKIYEPVHTSMVIKGVLEKAAQAPAAAAMVLDCMPEDEAVPVQETRIAHALCRAGEEPMANYSLQEPKPHVPIDTSGVTKVLSELMAGERMWKEAHAQMSAQIAAHARDLADVRVAVTAPRVPNTALHAEMDELMKRLKTYNEAINTAYEFRKSGDRCMENAVEEVLKYAEAAYERNNSA